MTTTNNHQHKVVKGYELIERIGLGGFGAVYRASQPVIGREVAIKIILPQYANLPDFIRRFEVEAQLVAHLEHPHIVPLYDYWREPDGAYLVMRYLRGGSLSQSLAAIGPWILPDSARLLEQVAAALSVAHRHGIVHRDIKPANILLDEEQNAYLTDFGIAKDLTTEIELPQTDGIVGSPYYLSPEQIRNESVTMQSDLYSLGILIYELLTGAHPFSMTSPITLMMKHLDEPLPALPALRPDLPSVFDEIIQKATAKDPADRYETAEEIAFAFRLAVEGLLRSPEKRGHQPATVFIVDRTPVNWGKAEPENPYKGLRAFQEADARNFFGRRGVVQVLLNHFYPLELREETMSIEQKLPVRCRFLAVVGPSGSGKSSVVKAGLLPAIRQGRIPGSSHWFVVEMIPSTQPFAELAAALLRVAVHPPNELLTQLQSAATGLHEVLKLILPADGQLFLHIDQFEELFTLTDDAFVRFQFLESLRQAVEVADSRLRLVLTLRADFYDQPLLFPEFGELIRQGTEVILPLNRQELEEAVVGPGGLAGIQFEEGLVETIINDVRDEPGSLPLLQYALTELFERRQGRLLTKEAYQMMGGALGALGRRADELYNGLDVGRQEVARQLFLRLVTLGEGTEDTRRRVLRTDLNSIAKDVGLVNGVIDAFGRYRLLSFDRDPGSRSPTVEVGHEALIRQWGRLREWLDESRGDVRLERQLEIGAADWESAGKDPSFLLRGNRLTQYEEWASHTNLALTQHEQTYLQASIAERNRRQAEEAARQQREAALERRSQRILQVLVIVLCAATILSLLLSGFAFNQSNLAEQNALVAAQNAATATVAQGRAYDEAALALSAQAEAMEQAHLAATSAAVAVNQEATAASSAMEAKQSAAESQSLALAANSQALLLSGISDLALSLALEANRLEDVLPAAQLALADAAYALGTRLVISGHKDNILSVTFSPDEKMALSASADHTLRLWDLGNGELVRQFGSVDNSDPTLGHTNSVQDADFAPDGSWIVSTSQDGTLIVWDVATGKLLQHWGLDGKGHQGQALSVEVSADGKLVLSAGEDGSLILWSVEDGTVVRHFVRHTGTVFSATISPDGLTALSGAEDGLLIWWDLATGKALRVITAHTAPIYSVAFTPDGMGAVAGAFRPDNRASLWNLQTGELLQEFVGHPNGLLSVAVSPDGRQLLTSGVDTSIRLWDLATGRELQKLLGHEGLAPSVTFNHNGRLMLSGSFDLTVRLWTIVHGANVGRLRLAGDGPSIVNVSADGEWVAVGGNRGTIGVWNRTEQTWQWVAAASEEGHTDRVSSISFSPDGRQLLSSSFDKKVLLWDVPTGEVLESYLGHSEAVFEVVFSPDGKLAASGSGDSQVVVWQMEGVPASQAEKYRLTAHAGIIRSLAFSPDGQWLLSGAGDRQIILWEMSTGNEVRRFVGHQSDVVSLDFNADGTLIFSGSGDRTVRWWDVQTGQEQGRFTLAGVANSVALTPDGRFVVAGSNDGQITVFDMELQDRVRRWTGHKVAGILLAMTPDGKYVFSVAAQDGRSRLLPDDVLLWRLDGSLTDLLEWTYGNRYVKEVSCGERAQYRVQPLCVAGGTPEPLPALAEATYTSDKPLAPLVLTTVEAQPLPTATPLSPTVNLGPIRAGINFFGDLVASSGVVWEYAGNAGETLNITLEADNPVNETFGIQNQQARGLLDTYLILRAPDGTVLGENDDILNGTVTDSALMGVRLPVDGVYQIEVRSYLDQTGGRYILFVESLLVIETLSVVDAGLWGMAISPDGQLAAGGAGKAVLLGAAGEHNQITLWHLGTGQILDEWEGHSDRVSRLVFSPNGNWLLSAGSWDGTLLLWDVATGEVIRSLGADGTGHTDYINSVQISPDGETAISVSSDRSLILWDLGTGAVLQKLVHSNRVPSVAYHPTENLAVFGDDAGTIAVWNLTTGTVERIFNPEHQGWILSLAFSPDGQFLLSSSGQLSNGPMDNSLRLWRFNTGEEIRQFGSFNSNVNSVVFSPDGLYLIAGTGNLIGDPGESRVHLFEVETGTELAVFERHSNVVWQVAFSPDGLTVYSASWDGFLYIWDVSEFVGS